MSFLMRNKAVFFDRDGIINQRIIGGYVIKPEQFKLNPEIVDVIKFIKENNFLAILITNQQGVGKGLMTLSELDEVHSFMQNLLLEKCGYNFDDIYFCTELAVSNSYYRKPNPGMLIDAINKWKIETDTSIMIGDTDSDIIAGKSSGLKTILVSDTEGNAVSDHHVTDLGKLYSLLKNILGNKPNA